MIELRKNGLSVTVDPENGGRICEALIDGVPFLRSLSHSADLDPRHSACFPLVPFSNRIENGQFRFDGTEYRVSPNLIGDPHPVHGEGWQRSWTVISRSRLECTLEFVGADWWPWCYKVRQHIKLDADSLHLSLEATNTGRTIMPIGLGFHPYFPRTSDTTLRFTAASVWPPIGDVNFRASRTNDFLDFSCGRPLAGPPIDHCFDGWLGEAIVESPETNMATRIRVDSNQGRCVVYAPPDQGFFCFEPVSHLNAGFHFP